MTSARTSMISVPGAHRLFLLALVSGCAARGERPLPLDAAGGATVQAAVHHEVTLTLLPAEERVLVEDAVTLSPELRARLGASVVFSLHAGLSPERAGAGAPLVPARAAAKGRLARRSSRSP